MPARQKYRSARLKQTAPKGQLPYRTAVMCASSSVARSRGVTGIDCSVQRLR
jgi:hypothetical protein